MKKTYTAEEVELMIDEIALSWVTRQKKFTAELVWMWNGNEEYAKKIGIKNTRQLMDHVYDEIKDQLKDRKRLTARFGVYYSERCERFGDVDRYTTMRLIDNDDSQASKDAYSFLKMINKRLIEIQKIVRLPEEEQNKE